MSETDKDRQAPHGNQSLIEGLRKNASWPHPVTQVEVIETHISWVILTGDYAYKIKKPVDLDFVDFSTLERRRYFCDEELRLNRHWAPELYLDVVAIGGTPQRPVVDGDGPVIEYAVRMRQFPKGALLSEQLDAGKLVADDLRALAETIADRHEAAPVSRIEVVKSGLLRHEMMENFDHLAGLEAGSELRELQSWTERELERRHANVRRRQRGGFLRECHGDLHLRNLVRLQSGIVAFDCVEFSEELRSIDVMSDVAFLVMDLVARERHDLAYAFLNRYLECTGDYSGISVLSLYFVYHCLIRAKVHAIRHAERGDAAEASDDLGEMHRYCRVAAAWTKRSARWLILMHGYSGSGKTWLAGKLMTALPAIRVRSDIERKRLYGLRESERSDSAPGRGMYGKRAARKTYRRLTQLAAVLLDSGENVILDAAFLERDARAQARAAAESTGTDCRIVDAVAPRDVLTARIKERSRRADDASEADLGVLDYQVRHPDPLTGDERDITLEADTTGDDPAARLIRVFVPER